jgi:hypothetical protein
MRTRTIVTAAVFYAALTLVLTYPYSARLATHVLSLGTDMDLAVWTIGWDVHALTHQPWAIFDANIFFPFHNSLAYSENLIGSALLAAPVIWLTGNTVLAMNLVVLFSVAASAFGAFLLARRLGLTTPAAVIAGLIFGFAPPRFFRIDQLPISTVQWIPFTLLALHAYVDTGRARYLQIAVALYSLQAITSGHGAAMLTLAVAVLLIWKYLCGEPPAVVRRLRDIGWPGALAMVPAALVYVPYKLAQVEVGLKRQLDDWTLSTPSYFASPTLAHQWLLAHLPDWHWLKGAPDAWLFPGVLPLLLAVVAVWPHLRTVAPGASGRGWRRLGLALEALGLAFLAVAVWVTIAGGVRVKAGDAVLFTSHGATPWIQFAIIVALRLAIVRRAPIAIGMRLRRAAAGLRSWRQTMNRPDHLWLYAGLFVLCVWLSIGPPLGIWRVMYWMPGLNFIRMPSRFTVVGMLALGIVAASGFDRLTAHARSATRLAAGTLVAALLIGEFAMLPMWSEPFVVDPPAIDRWVGAQPQPMALLEMPLSDSLAAPRREQWTTRFMLHSMAHWKPLFLGFSGIQPPGYQENYWTFVNFPDEKSLALARRLGITHVILHADLIPPTERAMVEGRFARFADQVLLVHTEGDGRLYAIRP